jgi:hypothetical protein
MRKGLVYSAFVLGLLLTIVIISSASVSAAEGTKTITLWSFSKFVNNYKVYNTFLCDASLKKACPNEIGGWQGKRITFKFYLKTLKTGSVRFVFNNVYTISPKYVHVYAGRTLTGMKLVKSDVFVDGTGEYAVDIPLSRVHAGWNYVQLDVKNPKVGYGQPSTGFVLGSVRLEEDVKA